MFIFCFQGFLDSKSLLSLSDTTGLQQMRITLSYEIRTLGFDSEDILSGTNNNIADILINGVTTVILSILNDSEGQSLFLPPSRRMTERLQSDKKHDEMLSVHPHKASDTTVFEKVRLKQAKRNLARIYQVRGLRLDLSLMTINKLIILLKK